MSVKCNTELDLPADGFIYSGQEITGRVTLRVNKPTPIRGVTVEVKGKGKCKWYETRSAGSQNITVWYTGKEKYLSTVKDLIKTEEGETVTLAIGVHTFPFRFHIPAGVPSATELPDAHIRYCIQTQVHRQRERKLTFHTPFIVLSHLDLNMEPFAREPVFAEQTKKFCNFFVKGGEMSVEVRSPAGGYVPGQVVPLACRIVNESRVQVKNIEAALFKVITYTENGGHYRKPPPLRVARVVCDKLVLEQDGSMNTDLQLSVPADLATSLYNNKIISIEYILKVKVKVAGLHRSPVVYIPLVIGSLPLYDLPVSSADYVPDANDPPPSYEEIMRGCSFFSSCKEMYEPIKAVPSDDVHKPPIE